MGLDLPRSVAMEELRPHELQRDFGSEDEIVIKDSYDHKNTPWSHECQNGLRPFT